MTSEGQQGRTNRQYNEDTARKHEYMTDTEIAEQEMRIEAVQIVRRREKMSQSPVPGHCIRFDLRSEGRKNQNPSDSRKIATALAADPDYLVPFTVGDVPEDDEELAKLLDDEPAVKKVDGGWTSNHCKTPQED